MTASASPAALCYRVSQASDPADDHATFYGVTPTSGSWLNAVENFFSVLTRKRIRRGTFYSLIDLQVAIKRYLAEHNKEPKAFVWAASAASILGALERLPASCV